ncbi:MAG TPA: AAA family ATPase [Chthoniobacteraceae bacterium]|nr:AAA family ATPase [Chthoniobacteraceae bacterium]
MLAGELGRKALLYDKFHEAEFARRDLGIYLPELYHKEADLVVVVLSPGYESKQWTGLEWTAIHDLLSLRRDDEVLLCRFGRATVAGLYSTAGYLELDGRAEQEIADLILERLAAVDRRRSAEAAARLAPSPAPPTTSIPHNLPSLQPFFGREEELAKIADALDPESRGWGALIDGPGGMGKTSLAVRAAYDASPAVFQKIIFVSLKTRELDDDGLRDLSGFILSGLAELFGELARELGRPEILKSAEDQRPRLLLDALRGTQTLLLLDNLESLLKRERDTVFTFVNKLPAGCKAILTSRGRIGSGAQELILEKLSEAAALATLAELAMHNPLLAATSEAERLVLYRETGGKPLLLRWTAGQLGRGSCRTFADARHFLGSCPPENDPMEFIFGDLVKEFTSDETRVLCALTYFALPAKVEHVAPIGGLEGESVWDALRTLANRSLVVPDSEGKAYALVPMVAEFLRKRCSDAIAAIGVRLERHVFELIIENGFNKHDRFPTLNAEWPSVAAALPLFVAGPNPRLQLACDALADFLKFTGRYDERLLLNLQAETKAIAAGDPVNAGWRAYRAGTTHYRWRHLQAVRECVERAWAHWQSPKAGNRERAMAILLRGMGHCLDLDYVAAAVDFREAIELHGGTSHESREVAMALRWLAYAEMRNGDLGAAEMGTWSALRVARAVNDAEAVAYNMGHLAELALARQSWPEAEAFAREALPLSEKVGRQDLIAANCLNIAKAMMRQGGSCEALPHARRAIEIFANLRSPDLEMALETLRECGG